MPVFGPRSRRLVRIALAGTGAIVLLAVVFGALRRSVQGESGDSAPDLVAAPVERRDLEETIAAAGRLEPIVRVPVIAEVSGIIARVLVEEGERVVRGQPLFELDRERLEARVAERRADLAFQQAEDRRDRVGRAQAERDQARRERDRTARLLASRVSSGIELERAEHALRLAEIAVGDAHAEAAARRASVDRARELLRQAERDLESALVRAPIDGVVVERPGEVGRAVADVTANGGTVIAEIADDRRIRLLAKVDENDVASVAVGQAARITLDAFPDERFEGRVRKISAAGTEQDQIADFEVELALDPDPRLRIGMSADARIVVREHESVVLVPNDAIVREEGGMRVRVPEVGGGGFRLVPIETGYSDGFHTVVSRGLTEGDVILVGAES
jgi:HlyD family secretion protein